MNQWQAYLNTLEQRVRMLEQRLLAAENELRVLKEQVSDIKPIHIDNIHYKVQELAVSNLSGTLNIGLTALADPKQLEEWVQQQTVNGNGGTAQGEAGEDKGAVPGAGSDSGSTPVPVQLDNLYGSSGGNSN